MSFVLFFYGSSVHANSRNSRQIRPPIYSMKQSKLRRRRVVRYAILYFTLLVVFIALIVGPIVAGKFIYPAIDSALSGLPFKLVQPTGLDRDYTNSTLATGTGREGYTGAGSKPSTTGGDSSVTGKIKLF